MKVHKSQIKNHKLYAERYSIKKKALQKIKNKFNFFGVLLFSHPFPKKFYLKELLLKQLFFNLYKKTNTNSKFLCNDY